MCGRYLFSDGKSDEINSLIEEAKHQFPECEFQSLSLNEVFPTAKIITYIFDPFDRHFHMRIMVWGLPDRSGRHQINARYETIAGYHHQVSSACIVPACGYYEWSSNPKEKYYFSIAKPPVYLAAVYRKIDQVDYLAILTEEATGEQKIIHERQPILLAKRAAAEYCVTSDVLAAHNHSINERTMSKI